MTIKNQDTYNNPIQKQTIVTSHLVVFFTYDLGPGSCICTLNPYTIFGIGQPVTRQVVVNDKRNNFNCYQAISKGVGAHSKIGLVYYSQPMSFIVAVYLSLAWELTRTTEVKTQYTTSACSVHLEKSKQQCYDQTV